MKLSGNTILITGGTSGIGYELAAQFIDRGNTIIITGRDPDMLEKARRALPGIHVFQSDVSDPKAIPLLHAVVINSFPALNVLINNAGIMRKIDLLDKGNGLEDITREIETNLNGTVQMVTHFLPHLTTKKSAAIVNVSSGLAFVPLPIAPIYCAAKAGVHSFTQSLRVQLQNTNIRVFELAPPMTRTPLFTRDIHTGDLKGVHMMDVSTMVGKTIHGLERNDFEIRPGHEQSAEVDEPHRSKIHSEAAQQKHCGHASHDTTISCSLTVSNPERGSEETAPSCWAPNHHTTNRAASRRPLILLIARS
jgi:uncharacterized oxidoreductase